MASLQIAGRLPDFLIVGAPKAGTSALHSALAQHPQLAMSPVKEQRDGPGRVRHAGRQVSAEPEVLRPY